MEYKLPIKLFEVRKIKAVFIFIIAVIVLATIIYFLPRNLFCKKVDIITNNVQTVQAQDIALSLPLNLRIPAINVDALIEQVGLTLGGAVAVPKGPTNVAWYSLGPIPGEIGSSVIVGHYGWKDNIVAVFDNLNKLKIGDKISVTNENGEVIIFTVIKSKTYNENDSPRDVFISTDGKAHLNLITCKGVWDKNDKSYSERLVVFTDKD